VQDLWDKNPDATMLERDKAVENSMKKNQFQYYKVAPPHHRFAPPKFPNQTHPGARVCAALV